MDKKKLRNDLILIGSLLLSVTVALIVLAFTRDTHNLVAKISVRNEVKEVIDLSKTGDSDYFVDGINGRVHVHVHDGAIAIVESNCPHQDCVHMGYVKDANRPIICAYNAVSVVIEGQEPVNDVEVGF